jgi:hypothetical protein
MKPAGIMVRCIFLYADISESGCDKLLTESAVQTRACRYSGCARPAVPR